MFHAFQNNVSRGRCLVGFFQKTPRLLHVERDGLCLQLTTLVAHGELQLAWLLACLHGDNKLAGKETHGRIGEDLGRRGIAIADAAELAGTFHFETQLVGSSRHIYSTLVYERNGDIGEVFAIGTQLLSATLGPHVKLHG